MSFKKALALVLTLLVVFMPFDYSFAAVEVQYDVTVDGGTATVTSAVYGTAEGEAAGVTVSFAVYDGLNDYETQVDKKTGMTFDSYINGFYKYVLETFSFPVGDSYQCKVVYVGPPQPVPQFSGTVYLPGTTTPFTGEGRVEVLSEYDYFGDSQIKMDGTYSFGGLSDGTYYVVAVPNATGDYCKSNKIEIIISGGVLTTPEAPVDISLLASQFKGTVYGSDGVTPFVEGCVEINTENMYIDNVQIQQDGSFSVGGLSDGTYSLQARPYNESGDVCRSNKVEITITNGILTAPSSVVSLKMQLPQFSGSVVDPTGKFVENVSVEINDVYGKYVYNAFAGVGGIFKVAGLNDGDYKLRANPPDNSSYAASADVKIQILGSQIVGTSPVLTLSIPQVIGTVYDQSNNVVEYGYVEVKGPDGSYFSGIPTDGTGVFKIAGLPDGTFLLRAVKWGSALTPSAEYEITIVGGKYTPPVEGLKLKLTSPQATGTVYRSDGVTPEMNSWVEVSDSMGKYITGSQTDEEGLFYLGGLADGSYSLRANPNWENKTHTTSLAFSIDITGGIYSGGAIKLTLGTPQISGTIKDPEGAIVSNGYVEVQKSDNTWLPGVGIQNGLFALGSLGDGIYTIKAMPDGNTIYSASNKYTFKIENGSLVIYGDYTGVPVVLTLQAPQLTGTLVNPLGQQVKGGWVEVRSPDEKSGMYFGGASVDYTGQFRIAGLADGDYVLVAWPQGGTTYTSSKEITVTISNGKYSPPEGGLKLTLGVPQIKGEVIAPDGTPEANGYVEVMLADGTYIKGSGVDYMGDFTIGDLKDGKYYIKANPGYGSEYSASFAVEVTIANGTYSGGVLVLKLTSAQLTGNVLEPDGTTPVMSGWVSINKLTGENVGGAQIQNGTFKVGSLKPGNYKMIAYPDWNSSYGESNTLQFNIDTAGQYTGGTISLKMSSPQITGTVKGPLTSIDENNPMPYGFIEIKSGDMHIGGTGVDYNGTFKVSGLAPGTYKLAAMAGGETTYSPSAEVTVVIGSDGTYQGVNPLTINLTTAQINGTVKDPDGNIAKFGYCEVTASNGEWITGTSVNQNGKFAIGNLADGTYSLKVYPDYMQSSSYSASEPLTVVIAGGVCTTNGGNINVNLTQVQLTGTVVEPDSSGKPVNMGWVEIQKDDGLGNWTWESGTGLNWQGEFSLGGLADGKYRLKAYPEWANNTYSPSSYVEFIVSGGKVTTAADLTYAGSVTVTLTQAQISGTITGPGGETIEYGWVEITNQAGAFVTGIGAKDDGSFSLGGLSDGAYNIKAYPGWKSSFTPSKLQTLTISGGTYSGGTLSLKLTSVQVTGSVSDPDSNPVNWGWVEVYDNNGQWIASTGVDETGLFRLSGIENGIYKIQAFPEPGSTFAASPKVSMTIAGGIMTNPNLLELVLTEPTMTGKVFRPDGTNAKAGWVEIGDTNANWLITAPINKDGTFKLPDLDVGQYKIQAFPREGSAFASSNILDLTVNDDRSYSPTPLELHFTNP